ncbi:hypothetical protein J4Q44_G00184770 [Coregonus suidteri]|uniref:Uncharacterized protein n=1 Tax=Coregonus suidteri TaxID=861788 RepID=A0AAN8LLB7_9TELE
MVLEIRIVRSFPGNFHRESIRGKRHPTASTKVAAAIAARYVRLIINSLNQQTELLKDLRRFNYLKRDWEREQSRWLRKDAMKRVLDEQYPKIKDLSGGWICYKATGGSEERKLSVVPNEPEGYIVRMLKSATTNGKPILTAGEILATSLAQGGPAPIFLSDWCYHFLCTGEVDKEALVVADMADLEYQVLICMQL